MLPTFPGLSSALADRYTLHSVLGVGGTSTVYRARDEKHARDVAIKVLRPELAASLTRQRFTRETSIVAKLQHPHILALIDSGTAADTYYFVMPLVEGVTLRERLDEGDPPSVGEVTRILADLADALAYAHERGVVHRDIKPSNVLLTGRHALLMDFGVAKGVLETPEANLTVGIALGTPAYMAPEQAMALPEVDHRADVYALGVLGYELLAGQPPFAGGSPQDVLAAHVSRPPEDLGVLRPDIPEPLRDIVMRCLEKDVGARWQDARTIVLELDALVTPSGGMTPVTGTPAFARFASWKQLRVAVPVVALVVAGAILATRGGSESGALRVDREQVTFAGDVIESAVSADGEWLAYVTSDETEQKLYVRDLGAETALELDHAEEIGGLVWSDDGSEIAYHSGPADPVVRAVPRLGGPGRVLGRGHQLASPDLSRLAQFRTMAGPIRLMTLDLRDTVAFQAPAWTRWTQRVAWSPRSNRVAIEVANPDASDYGILLGSADGELVEIIRDSARVTDPSFSRDGRFLYFMHQPAGELPDLMRLTVDATGRTTGSAELVIQDFDGDLRDGFFYSDFLNRFTHTDQDEIFYVRTEGESNVWAFDLDAPDVEPVRVTTGSAIHTEVRASPDGTRIATVRTTRIGSLIGVMPLEGGPLLPIVTALRSSAGLAWSPSGDRLAMTVSQPRTDRRIEVYDVSTGNTRTVGPDRVGGPIVWAGDQLVVQSEGRRDLLLVDPETGEARVAVADTLGFNFYPRASPDGARVAYFKRQGEFSGLWVQELTPGAAERSVLLDELNPIGFDATGERLYAADNGLINRPQRVLEILLSTGAVRTLATLPADYLVHDITPDGTRVLATHLEWRGDVWRLTPRTVGPGTD